MPGKVHSGPLNERFYTSQIGPDHIVQRHQLVQFYDPSNYLYRTLSATLFIRPSIHSSIHPLHTSSGTLLVPIKAHHHLPAIQTLHRDLTYPVSHIAFHHSFAPMIWHLRTTESSGYSTANLSRHPYPHRRP